MVKCGFCKNTTFALEDNEPRNSNFRYSFIKCGSCNAVVGVVEAVNPIAELDDVKRQLAEITSRLPG
jgi:hypothetical protein